MFYFGPHQQHPHRGCGVGKNKGLCREITTDTFANISGDHTCVLASSKYLDKTDLCVHAMIL